MNLTESHAKSLDEQDNLASIRHQFYIPKAPSGGDAIYFTGNSLGLQPKTVRNHIEQELADWETYGVDGHFHAKNPWLSYHELLTESLANIIGAKPIETVAMNSLTVNLHFLMVSFYRPTKSRRKIVIEKGAFPSDRYAVASQIHFHGYSVNDDLIELEPLDGETTLRTEDILAAIEREGESIALVLLGGINYYTGQVFDMQTITKAGHDAGAKVGFDLAHAIGNVELKMHDWGVDFAAWCSYKYLNGGPGAIGGAFVHERHSTSSDLPRFAGWWGHDKDSRFQMGPDFSPIPGADGWQVSNSPIFQLAALRASLEIFDEVGMPALVAKSRKLTGYLENLLDEVNDKRITVITPRDPEKRGCQLSIRVENSDKTLFEALGKKGVIADWREPDVIRVAPVPLYNSFFDVCQFVEILRGCLSE